MSCLQDSWESEDNIPIELVEELQQQQPQLFKGLKLAGGKKKRKKARAQQQQQQQQRQQLATTVQQPGSSSNGASRHGSSSGLQAVEVAAQQVTSRERETVSAG